MGTTANSVQDLQFLNMVKLYFLSLVNKNLYNFAVERVFSVDIYCYIVNLQIRWFRKMYMIYKWSELIKFTNEIRALYAVC